PACPTPSKPERSRRLATPSRSSTSSSARITRTFCSVVMPSIIRYRPGMTGGLTRRTVIASGVLAVIIGTAFGVLVLSIVDLNRVEQRSRRAEEVLVVANQFERLLVDAETGVRGF